MSEPINSFLTRAFSRDIEGPPGRNNIRQNIGGLAVLHLHLKEGVEMNWKVVAEHLIWDFAYTLRKNDELTARATKAESRADGLEREVLEYEKLTDEVGATVVGLKQELAEQEREKLALIKELDSKEILRSEASRLGNDCRNMVTRAISQLKRSFDVPEIGPGFNGFRSELEALIHESWKSETAPAPLPSSPAAAPPEDSSQLPWNPGFIPKCHGCGLPEHAKRCMSEGCPAKEAAATTTGEGKEAVLTSCCANRDGECYAAGCPQLRDNEPHATGRFCPLPDEDDD